MKKIEIEIPDGKCVKWVNNVLTLVDDAPKDVRERIKTVQDACNELGEKHPLVTQYRLSVAATYIGDPMTEDFIAYLKLCIIVAALNEGWEPQFVEGEERWYLWFNIKDGLVYACAGVAGSYSYAVNGVRLAFKTEELAEYAGKQFIDIYKDFCFKTPIKSNEQDL